MWESPRQAYPIDEVLPGSRAANAGIRPGDRVVRIDHVEPRGLTHLRRKFDDAKALPVFVEVDREFSLFSRIGRQVLLLTLVESALAAAMASWVSFRWRMSVARMRLS